jgi:hypothetical protein
MAAAWSSRTGPKEAWSHGSCCRRTARPRLRGEYRCAVRARSWRGRGGW